MKNDIGAPSFRKQQNAWQRIISISNDLFTQVLELYMEIFSERWNYFYGIFLVAFFNIVLIAAVVLAFNDESSETLKLQLTGSLVVLSFLNACWFSMSQKQYIVLEKNGNRKLSIQVWDPPVVSVCLWCGFSPPHVMAIGMCETSSTYIQALLTALMISSALTVYHKLAVERESQMIQVYAGAFEEMSNKSHSSPTLSHYCKSLSEDKLGPKYE
eukprot:CFRG7580T1